MKFDLFLDYKNLSAFQVILGRSTDDFDVDIDLGRGGGTNKISRRQVWLIWFSCIMFFGRAFSCRKFLMLPFPCEDDRYYLILTGVDQVGKGWFFFFEESRQVLHVLERERSRERAATGS